MLVFLFASCFPGLEIIGIGNILNIDAYNNFIWKELVKNRREIFRLKEL